MAPPMTFGGIDSAGAVDDAFWTWATAEGVEAVSCAPALFREGWRGVAATGDVAPGDVVLRVPGSLLMSARSAARDPDLAAALETHGGALSPAERLSCHLLHESSKGARSRWSAYVKQLPRRYNLLACWTDTEIEALQAPEAIAVAERAATDMCASHERALPTLKHLGLPLPFRSARAWKWARGTVSSRTVFVPFDDAGALCPVGDLFNYAPPAGGSAAVDVIGTPLSSEALGALRSLNDPEVGAHTRTMSSRESPRESSSPPQAQAPLRVESADAGDGSYDARADAYVFYARRRYGRGDQIMLCYGAHTNLSLLEHYGFLLSPETTNGNDAAPLAPIPAFGNDASASNLANDEDATRRVEPSRFCHRLATDAFGRLPWTALADLRVDAACADADVRRLGLAKRARDVCRRGDAVSPAVERRVFEAVRDAAGRTLLGLGTTAARDEADIAAASARASERATAIPASSTQRETRDAGLDEHGAPREWTRVDDDDDDDDDADFQTSNASNAQLAARWRLAYKRAVQAAYRRAQARVDEAVEAIRAAGRGDAITPSSDARVAKPRLRAAR